MTRPDYDDSSAEVPDDLDDTEDSLLDTVDFGAHDDGNLVALVHESDHPSSENLESKDSEVSDG
jgi:hypothetical protein